MEAIRRQSNDRLLTTTARHNTTNPQAINDGYYVFAWRGADGKEVEKRARYSFVYRKDPATGRWMIVDHHSSLLPTAPKGLQPATTVVL